MLPNQAPAAATNAPSLGLIAQLTALIKSVATGSTERHASQRDAFFIVFVRAASAAILYLSHVVLARWLGTGDYGIYVWVWTLVVVLGGLSHLGVGGALAPLMGGYRQTQQFDLLLVGRVR